MSTEIEMMLCKRFLKLKLTFYKNNKQIIEEFQRNNPLSEKQLGQVNFQLYLPK